MSERAGMDEALEAFAEQVLAEIREEAELEVTGWAAELVDVAQARLNEAYRGGTFSTFILCVSGANAFTLPGRYIYLSRELLSRGLSEAGAAFVIAHEMAHHALGHLEAAERAIGERHATTTSIKNLVLALSARLRMGPDQELEADRFALDLCLAAGYDACGAAEALDLFERVQLDYRAVESVFDEPKAPRLFGHMLGTWRVHPATRDRRAAIARAGRETGPGPLALAAGRGVASTAMIQACLECYARFARAASCPRCGAWSVVELGDLDTRAVLAKRAIDASSGYRWTDRTKRVAAAGAVGALPVGAVTALLLTGTTVAAAIGAGIITATLAAGAYALGRHRSESRHGERPLSELAARLPPLDPFAALPRHDREEVRVEGHVHVIRPIESPLSGERCAAVRIVGEGVTGRIDDARVAHLEVRGEGVVARIATPYVLLDLPVTAKPEAVVIAGELEEFLRPRGLAPRGASASLAEARLSEGDRVVVEGAAMRVAAAGERRGSSTTLVFRDWPLVRLLERAS